jgi:hypothetical protein
MEIANGLIGLMVGLLLLLIPASVDFSPVFGKLIAMIPNTNLWGVVFLLLGLLTFASWFAGDSQARLTMTILGIWTAIWGTLFWLAVTTQAPLLMLAPFLGLGTATLVAFRRKVTNVV